MNPFSVSILKRSFTKINKKKIDIFCVNCIHFNEYQNLYPYDEIPDKTIYKSTCRKFVTTNMVTGMMEFKNALECRHNETLCGKDAIHYDAKK
jgi:hypothetical protein